MSELRYVCKSCGKTYKVLTWFNKHVEKYHHELDPIELLNNNPEIQFLKCEINFLKQQFRELKSKGFMYSNIEPIERIKEDRHRPERDQFKMQFNVVIKELKIKLQVNSGEVFDYHNILNPINPRETIEEPPIIESLELIHN